MKPISLKTLAAFATTLLLAACATQPPPAGSPPPVTAPSAPSASNPAASGAPGAPSASSPAPAYLQAEKGCAILVGGDVGSRFEDKQIQQIWQKVNVSITNELYSKMLIDGYKVNKLIIEADQADDLQAVVIEALAANRCNRVMQISHLVSEDEKGRFFRFDVALMRFEPKGDRPAGVKGTNTVTVAEFLRNYRYERTQQVFDNFYTGAFADRLLADLNKSGALTPLR